MWILGDHWKLGKNITQTAKRSGVWNFCERKAFGLFRASCRFWFESRSPAELKVIRDLLSPDVKMYYTWHSIFQLIDSSLVVVWITQTNAHYWTRTECYPCVCKCFQLHRSKRRNNFVPTTSNNFLSFNILLPTCRLAMHTRPPGGGVGYPPRKLKFQAA